MLLSAKHTQDMSAKDAADVCSELLADGCSSMFIEKVAALGKNRQWLNNLERDLLHYAKKTWGICFHLYYVNTYVRAPLTATKDVSIGMLLQGGGVLHI